MSVTPTVGRPSVPTSVTDSAIHRRLIAEGVNRLNQGHSNTTLFVTFDPGTSETVVTDSRISLQTCVSLHPQTANAAAALPTTYTVCTNGSMTINHASSTDTDLTFTVGLNG
jgi:hypothetical protein